MKKILIGIAVLLVIVIGGATYFFTNLDSFIKQAIEKYGSEATQADVTLDGVDIDFASGKAGLNGFVVGNPQGFDTDSAFNLGAISVQIDPTSVDGDTIIIKSVEIRAPKITYELDKSGGSNVDAIKSNVDAYAQKFASSGGSSSAESGSSGEEKKLIIEKLSITGGEVKVAAGFLGGKEVGAKLPNIMLADIGKDKGGATIADVIKQVIDQMTSGIGSAVSGLNLDDLQKSAQQAVDGAVSKATDAVKSATEGASGGNLGGAADEAGQKLKNLLGN